MKVLRIFAVWLIVLVSVLTLMLGFEFVNKTVAKSGFSSGEVFEFSEKGGIIEGEILGRSFSADISPVVPILPYADNLLLLLPPYAQLFLRCIYFFASMLF